MVDVDRFFRDKNLEDLTRKTYDSMDLEVRDVLAKSDLYERDGRSQHGFYLSVGREYPYKVRVLANVRSDSYCMDRMLHEFGHAVYVQAHKPEATLLPAHHSPHVYDGGDSALVGSLVDDPAWISAIVGVPEVELDQVRGHLLWREREDTLIFIRWRS
jgi:peptidyl-dipeptidase A